jgi:hypothetical protein
MGATDITFQSLLKCVTFFSLHLNTTKLKFTGPFREHETAHYDTVLFAVGKHKFYFADFSCNKINFDAPLDDVITEFNCICW